MVFLFILSSDSSNLRYLSFFISIIPMMLCLCMCHFLSGYMSMVPVVFRQPDLPGLVEDLPRAQPHQGPVTACWPSQQTQDGTAPGECGGHDGAPPLLWRWFRLYIQKHLLLHPGPPRCYWGTLDLFFRLCSCQQKTANTGLQF